MTGYLTVHQARKFHPAVVRTGTGPVLQNVATPQPPDGGVLIALESVGVCGTDLQILRGLRADPTPILGHEAVGEIILNNGSTFEVGQRVVFNPTHPKDQDRILGHTLEGAFQRYLTLTAGDVQGGMVEPLGERLPSALGPLVEPLAAVIYGLELLAQNATVQPKVAIYGAGTVGLLMALEVADTGGRPILIHPRRQRLAWAIDRGFAKAGDALEADNESTPHSELVGAISAAVICTPQTGSLTSLRQALGALAPGGAVDLIGGFPANASLGMPCEPPIDIGAVRRANAGGRPQPGVVFPIRLGDGRRVTISGHRGVGARHIRLAVKRLEQRPTHYGRLITHLASLTSVAPLLARYCHHGERRIGNDEWIKLVVDCRLEGERLGTFDAATLANCSLQATEGCHS